MSRHKVNPKILIELYEEGKSFADIAEEVGLTRQGVKYTLNKLGYEKQKAKHKYEIGEIVNNSVRIVQKLYNTKDNSKSYVVQSLAYPNEKNNYIVTEDSVKNAKNCAYVSGFKVCVESSLYGVESIRKYIPEESVEFAKTVTPTSPENIVVECDNCGNKKEIMVRSIIRQGIACQKCSKSISYSESFFQAYLAVKNISHEPQIGYKDLGRRKYDFKIELNGDTFLVETHGLQHYFEEDLTYYKVETIQESDNIKRQYAKDNNINLIELDCRKSEFEFIQNSIAENNILPNIEESDIPKMLDLMEKNSKYDVKRIVKEYKEGKTKTQLAKEENVGLQTMINLLKRNNVR